MKLEALAVVVQKGIDSLVGSSGWKIPAGEVGYRLLPEDGR